MCSQETHPGLVPSVTGFFTPVLAGARKAEGVCEPAPACSFRTADVKLSAPGPCCNMIFTQPQERCRHQGFGGVRPRMRLRLHSQMPQVQA